MFWSGLLAIVFSAAILASIGFILAYTFRDYFPVLRYLGLMALALGVLFVISSPFLLVARVESSAIVSRAGQDCGSNQYRTSGKSLLGHDLFTFHSTTEWCWDGTQITKEPFHFYHVAVFPVFWEYSGTVGEGESGGARLWSHLDHTQGKFSLCLPLMGCTQSVYPYVEKRQYGDGTATATDVHPLR